MYVCYYCCTSPVLPLPAETQSPKVLVDDVEEILEPEGDMASLKVLHVVGTLHVIMDHPPPCGPKHLNGIELPNLHTSGLLDCSNEGVVLWIECHSKDTVNDVAIDASVKVQLHDIVILQDSVVTNIGGVVGHTVVDGATHWKSMTYRTK